MVALHRCRLHVVQRLIELQVDICLDDTNLIIGFALDDIDSIVSVIVLDVDRIALEHTSVIGQLSFQDGLRIRKINEGSLVGLYLHVGAFR